MSRQCDINIAIVWLIKSKVFDPNRLNALVYRVYEPYCLGVDLILKITIRAAILEFSFVWCHGCSIDLVQIAHMHIDIWMMLTVIGSDPKSKMAATSA